MTRRAGLAAARPVGGDPAEEVRDTGVRPSGRGDSGNAPARRSPSQGRQLPGPLDPQPACAGHQAERVITTFDLDEYVYGALKAGARGFLKDAGAEMLTQAVHAAARGDALIAPNITARLLSSFANSRPRSVPPEPVEPLTAREEQVLLTAARGRTNSEIGDELSISLSTVKTHIAALMRKLNARNRVEIVMWAYETRRVGT